MNTFINTDKALLDVPWVCRTLRAEHFGWALTDDGIKAQIEHQLCFGLYEDESYLRAEGPIGNATITRVQCTFRQIGFCSVVTDTVAFSVLGNVVIDPAHRRKGLGQKIVAAATRHPDVKKTICLLATRDAIAFYEKLGFKQMPYYGMQKDPM